MSNEALLAHMHTSLVTEALRVAWFRRHPAPQLIFHSDQGSGQIQLTAPFGPRRKPILILNPSDGPAPIDLRGWLCPQSSQGAPEPLSTSDKLPCVWRGVAKTDVCRLPLFR